MFVDADAPPGAAGVAAAIDAVGWPLENVQMTGYALEQQGAEELEQTRLSLLADRWEPFTIRQLDVIGVGEGWRCLDVGAGQGSVTRLLAARVGSTGSVLATDLDTRLLEPLVGDRVEVKRHDLMSDPLPDAAFDLVHVRNLLLHLPSRREALRRLLAATRPGGWIAVGDVDFTTVQLSPSTPAWKRTRSAFWDAAIAAGWDIRYGARLLSDLHALELADIEGQSDVRYERGSTANLFAHTVERLHERMISLGAAEDDLKETQRLLRDPDTGFRTPSISTGWGRRTH